MKGRAELLEERRTAELHVTSQLGLDFRCSLGIAAAALLVGEGKNKHPTRGGTTKPREQQKSRPELTLILPSRWRKNPPAHLTSTSRGKKEKKRASFAPVDPTQSTSLPRLQPEDSPLLCCEVTLFHPQCLLFHSRRKIWDKATGPSPVPVVHEEHSAPMLGAQPQLHQQQPGGKTSAPSQLHI